MHCVMVVLLLLANQAVIAAGNVADNDSSSLLHASNRNASKKDQDTSNKRSFSFCLKYGAAILGACGFGGGAVHILTTRGGEQSDEQEGASPNRDAFLAHEYRDVYGNRALAVGRPYVLFRRDASNGESRCVVNGKTFSIRLVVIKDNTVTGRYFHDDALNLWEYRPSKKLYYKMGRYTKNVPLVQQLSPKPGGLDKRDQAYAHYKKNLGSLSGMLRAMFADHGKGLPLGALEENKQGGSVSGSIDSYMPLEEQKEQRSVHVPELFNGAAACRPQSKQQAKCTRCQQMGEKSLDTESYVCSFCNQIFEKSAPALFSAAQQNSEEKEHKDGYPLKRAAASTQEYEVLEYQICGILIDSVTITLNGEPCVLTPDGCNPDDTIVYVNKSRTHWLQFCQDTKERMRLSTGRETLMPLSLPLPFSERIVHLSAAEQKKRKGRKVVAQSKIFTDPSKEPTVTIANTSKKIQLQWTRKSIKYGEKTFAQIHASEDGNLWERHVLSDGRFQMRHYGEQETQVPKSSKKATVGRPQLKQQPEEKKRVEPLRVWTQDIVQAIANEDLQALGHWCKYVDDNNATEVFDAVLESKSSKKDQIIRILIGGHWWNNMCMQGAEPYLSPSSEEEARYQQWFVRAVAAHDVTAVGVLLKDGCFQIRPITVNNITVLTFAEEIAGKSQSSPHAESANAIVEALRNEW